MLCKYGIYASDLKKMYCQQINEFVKLGREQLVPYFDNILGSILPCISDKEEKIKAVRLCTSLHLMLS